MPIEKEIEIYKDLYPQTPIPFGSIRWFRKAGTSEATFVRSVIMFLRDHLSLLEQEEYRRLYDECLDFLHRFHGRFHDNDQSEPSEEARKRSYFWLTFLLDLLSERIKNNNFNDIPTLTEEEVDSFLEYRKLFWKKT